MIQPMRLSFYCKQNLCLELATCQAKISSQVENHKIKKKVVKGVVV
jgi:hypothetical protein